MRKGWYSLEADRAKRFLGSRWSLGVEMRRAILHFPMVAQDRNPHRFLVNNNCPSPPCFL
jgi:hypothetical protein